MTGSEVFFCRNLENTDTCFKTLDVYLFFVDGCVLLEIRSHVAWTGIAMGISVLPSPRLGSGVARKPK